MILGITEIHKCPKCKALFLKGTLRSGNTIGATYFTDGKMNAVMLKEFPKITKCDTCNKIFWLNKPIGEWLSKSEQRYYSFKFRKPKNFTQACFLSIYEYQEAIDLEIYKNKEEEIFLRIKLWHSFNDRIRYLSKTKDPAIFYNELYKNENDQVLFETNCHKLIEILNKNDENDLLLLAELYRNIGNFDECISILQTVSNPKYQKAADFIKNECENSNRFCREITFFQKEEQPF